MASPTLASLLEVLSRDRLVEVGRHFEVTLRPSPKSAKVAAPARPPQLSIFPPLPLWVATSSSPSPGAKASWKWRSVEPS